jgi:hypothetical protein
MIIYEGDLFMEDYKRYTLGAGILTVSIIQLVLYGFTLLGLLVNLFMKDQIADFLSTQPGGDEALAALTSSQLTIQLVIYSLLFIALIVILFKKSLGVYTYFTCIAVNYIYAIIMGGFRPLSVVSLILPALLAFFIYKKKHLYFGDKDSNLNTYN